jgi:hypothetical protein
MSEHIELKAGEAIDFDATLRLLAQAEVPAGLAERVKMRIESQKAQGQVIAWPAKKSNAAGWLRRAAAAAIVCVIGGGSWAIYAGAHFDAAGAGAGQKPVVIPSQQGSFGNAGAIRKVDPLTAPVVTDSTQGAAKATKQKKTGTQEASSK